MSASQVEAALAASTADACVVIATASSSVNLRWANNTLTTNGAASDRDLTVVSIVGGRVGAVTRSAVPDADIEALVRDSEAVARAGEPSPEARDLPGAAGPADADFADPAGSTGVTALSATAAALGEAFARAHADGEVLYGFAEHVVSTTWLATSTGVRRRHVQPSGSLAMTAKSADLARSTWVGQATRDFTDIDVTALHAEASRNLDWARTSIELPAGRYPVLLSPSAGADLLVYALWSAGLRDAAEGRSVFSAPDGGVRIGERIASLPLTLASDPAAPGFGCRPFLATAASDSSTSVFDNGLPLSRTAWIEQGTLRALVGSRSVAESVGVPATPYIDNLLVSGGPGGSLADMIAATRGRALLLTCLWYIREVDPRTLLLTGLTRDGVYLIEDGAVVGEVNNFRFNESPVGMLARLEELGTPVAALPREWGDYFELASVPPMRIRDFNMSSVSQAR